MTIEEFNAKYSEENLSLSVLNSKKEAVLIDKDKELRLDYRFNFKDISTEINLPLTKNGVVTYVLKRGIENIGIATFIVIPRIIFEKINIIERKNNEYFLVEADHFLNKSVDYLLVRGWRVLKVEFRGKGIGLDLRKVISTSIENIILKNPKYNFGFWGSVMSTYGGLERELIQEAINNSRKNKTEKLDLSKLDTKLFGVPHNASIPAMIGYVKDGYTYMPNYFNPPSCGPFFIKML